VGNLSAGIFLPIPRMSTVKFGNGSLFCTPVLRVAACKAGFVGLDSPIPDGTDENQSRETDFLIPPQARRPLHSLYTGGLGFPLAGDLLLGAESKNTIPRGDVS
jgi:hypothetical protein